MYALFEILCNYILNWAKYLMAKGNVKFDIIIFECDLV